MREGKLLSLRRASVTAASMSDEALLAACGTGDLAALETLFDRFHTIVYRFLGRLSGTNDIERDDLVQATFLEVRVAAKRFRGTSSVKTWILGIAANLARHHLRSEHRRNKKHLRYVGGAPELPVRPDQQVEHRELLRAIEEAVAALSPEQQIAFILCDLEDLRGVDVARTLGVPQGTLWRRLHVARKALRAAVARAIE
jgi:RNA polymerase sigma-70 factor (ECF subfamily)